MISTPYVLQDPVPHAGPSDRLRGRSARKAGQEQGWSGASEALGGIPGRAARSVDRPPALAPEDQLRFVQAVRLALVLSAGLWGTIALGAWHLLG